MLKNIMATLCFILVAHALSFGAYGTISPDSLHKRLIAGDTLLILDVREYTSEYIAGHIAEPAGQLPLTPVNMPWTSGVLQANHPALPRDIDIVVHCRSGARSAAACTFLDSLGFTRIFNMTGGFNAWSYEKRTGGYGDGSGRWVRSTITTSDSVRHDSGSIVFFPKAMAGIDSLYAEIHFAYGKQPVPTDAPVSDIGGLYRLTLFDKFGLSLFRGDSLALADTAALTLRPRSKNNTPLPALTQTGVTALAGPASWKPLPSMTYQFPAFHGNSRVLRRWYNLAGTLSQAARRYPAHPSIVSFKGITGTPPVFDLSGRILPIGFIVKSGYYITVTPREQGCGKAVSGSRLKTSSPQ